MYTITVSQFDKIVKEYLGDIPEDSPKLIAKYSYEAHRAAIEELMQNVRSRLESGERLIADTDPEEAVYLFIVGSGSPKNRLIQAHRLNEKNLLHGLILVDITLRAGLSNLISLSNWNITEFHWFNSDIIKPLNSDRGNTRIPVNVRTTSLIFNVDNIKVVGLYGNSVSVWEALSMNKLPIEWLTIRSLSVPNIHQSTDVIVEAITLKVIDFEESMKNYMNLFRIINLVEYIDRVEWLSLPREIIAILEYDAPQMNTLILHGITDLPPITWQLVELDIGIFSVNKLDWNVDGSILEILRYRYERNVNHIIPDWNWSDMPNLIILEIIDPMIVSSRNDYNELSNVIELTIMPPRDSPIPSSIYQMPSLEVLTLVQASDITLKDLNIDRFHNVPEIITQ